MGGRQDSEENKREDIAYGKCLYYTQTKSESVFTLAAILLERGDIIQVLQATR